MSALGQSRHFVRVSACPLDLNFRAVPTLIGSSGNVLTAEVASRCCCQTCQKMRTMVNLYVSISRAIGIEPAERKAMALKKKATAKWRAWNKGLEVGQKGAFTPAQVKRIRQVLADRGVPGLRDLALFSVAIDTMLQAPELLNLTVKDVQLPNGHSLDY